MDRVEHGKRVTDFDRLFAERIYSSLSFASTMHSPLGQRLIDEIETAVKKRANPRLQAVITHPDPNHPVEEGPGRANVVRNLTSTDSADPLHPVLHKIVRTTFPAVPNVFDDWFVRRRVVNGLVALRSYHKAVVASYLKK